MQHRYCVCACWLHKPAAACQCLLEPPIQGSASQIVGSLHQEGRKDTKGHLRKPSHQEDLCFVSEAWAAVSEEIIARSFNGCGISNALDGTEDGAHRYTKGSLLLGLFSQKIVNPSRPSAWTCFLRRTRKSRATDFEAMMPSKNSRCISNKAFCFFYFFFLQTVLLPF